MNEIDVKTSQESSSRARLTNMRLGALRNPEQRRLEKVAAGQLVCVFQPIRNPVTGQVNKRKTAEAIHSMLFIYTLEHDGQVTALNREADVQALLDGEPLADVQARRERDAGDPFAAVERGLPGWAR